MALRIRFQHTAGASLGYSIERLSDGLLFDFSDGTFKAAPTTLISGLTADTGNFSGRYRTTLSNTPSAQFSNGDYCITVHDTTNSNVVVGMMAATMFNGDDTTIFPSSGVDPWSAVLPGSYPAGTAGAILGTNLDARISSRSTYAGGPVASVTAPVIVGTNNDKTGYSLSAAGLDAIPVENGVNARQALSPILAACAGVVGGAGTGSVAIKGANVATTRIMATTDSAGNRTAVTLVLPS